MSDFLIYLIVFTICLTTVVCTAMVCSTIERTAVVKSTENDDDNNK